MLQGGGQLDHTTRAARARSGKVGTGFPAKSSAVKESKAESFPSEMILL
jgi:hypothetical protein